MSTRLARLHASEKRRLVRATQAAVVGAWVRLGGHSSAYLDEFLSAAVPTMDAATATMVAATEGYLATSASASGVDGPVVGLEPSRYRRPVPPDQQWQRPFSQTWTAVAAGKTWPEAVAQGRHFTSRMVATDLQFASRGAAHDWMSVTPRTTGYSRVLGPGKNCKLCIAASDRRYHRSVLLPIHDNCGCTVAPLYEGDERTQGLTEGAYEASLAEDGVSVAEHGELGPYLYDSNHSPPVLIEAA